MFDDWQLFKNKAELLTVLQAEEYSNHSQYGSKLPAF
jgi:hypothetical protein